MVGISTTRTLYSIIVVQIPTFPACSGYYNHISLHKKESPIDINDEQFCLWQNKAVNAKNRYLAGELTEDEAIELIYVPRKDELVENFTTGLPVL